MSKTCYIDGDVLLYEVVYSTTSTMDCGDGWWQTVGDHHAAYQKFKARTLEVMEAAGCDQGIVCLSDHSNAIFRIGFYPDYKSNRKNKLSSRPPHFVPLKRSLLGLSNEGEVANPILDRCYSVDKGWATVVAMPTLEADDVISMLHLENPGVVATIDKDLYQLPGEHIHLETLQRRYIDAKEGNRLLAQQCLSGDPTDNIPGVPGIGKVRAERLLADVLEEDHWDTIVDKYTDSGQTEDDAYMNLMLVRMLRPGEYNGETHEINMELP